MEVGGEQEGIVGLFKDSGEVVRIDGGNIGGSRRNCVQNIGGTGERRLCSVPMLCNHQQWRCYNGRGRGDVEGGMLVSSGANDVTLQQILVSSNCNGVSSLDESHTSPPR